MRIQLNLNCNNFNPLCNNYYRQIFERHNLPLSLKHLQLKKKTLPIPLNPSHLLQFSR